MLQRNLQFPRPKPNLAEPGWASVPVIDALRMTGEVFRRQIVLIAVVAAFVMAGGVVFLVTTPAEYTARALLIIDTKKAQISPQQSTSAEPSIDSSFIESQVEIIHSDDIAKAVIRKLNLMEAPEFSGKAVPPSADSGEDAKQLQRAVRSFSDRLTVKRVASTYIIHITFRALEPERAARITNALAEAYITDQLNAKYEATKVATSWLQGRINDLHDDLAKAETAVVQFKTKNNIVSTGGTDNRLVGQQQISELNTELLKARGASADARARLDRINEVLKSGSVQATVTDALKSEVITKLRSQYFELALRESDWSSRYGSQHLAAVGLRKQMLDIQNAIFDEVRRLAETYKSELEISSQREAELDRDMNAAIQTLQTSDKAQITLRQLESNAQSYKTLYTNFLQQHTEAVQQQSFPISEARLIATADPPLSKSYPRTSLVLAASSVLALVLGFGLGWLRDKFDRTFRTSEDIEKTLGIACIALVPRFDDRTAGGTKRLFRHRNLPDGKPGPRMIRRDHDDLIWTATADPFSSYCEALRSLKLNLDLSGLVKATGSVGFTSSLPNEGKSTIAVALAQVIAASGASCLLVDCDLRNPTLSNRLARTAEAGLIEVLSGDRLAEEVLWKDASGFDFLPAVIPLRLANTSDILASDALRRLFAELRERYQYVLVDFSPISPVVDVRATASLVGSYVYVIEWGATKPDVVHYALRNAPELQENILGIVLNKVDLRTLRKYSGAYKDYHGNKYAARYGLDSPVDH
jgi:polysaccharide biosynthesis transport protein